MTGGPGTGITVRLELAVIFRRRFRTGIEIADGETGYRSVAIQYVKDLPILLAARVVRKISLRIMDRSARGAMGVGKLDRSERTGLYRDEDHPFVDEYPFVERHVFEENILRLGDRKF